MAYSHQNGGSPNTMTALLLAHAIAKLNPKETDNIVAGVAGDLRSTLRVHDSHNNLLTVYKLQYSKRLEALDFNTQATCFRGMLILVSDPDNNRIQLDNMKKFVEYLNILPTLAEKKKMALYAVQRGSTAMSCSVSYIGQLQLGKVGDHIKHIDIFVESGTPLLSVEIMCSKDRFYFSAYNNFNDVDILNALLDEFKKAGMECMDVVSYTAEAVPFDGLDNLEEV